MTNPERAVAQALRAQAGQASHPTHMSGPRPTPPLTPPSTVATTSPTTPSGQRMAPPRGNPFPTGWVLLIALLLGAVVGVGVALLSIFEPGMLPSWQWPS